MSVTEEGLKVFDELKKLTMNYKKSLPNTIQ